MLAPSLRFMILIFDCIVVRSLLPFALAAAQLAVFGVIHSVWHRFIIAEVHHPFHPRARL